MLAYIGNKGVGIIKESVRIIRGGISLKSLYIYYIKI